MGPKIAILTGPTAAGKSEVALRYCLRRKAQRQAQLQLQGPPPSPLPPIEIVNADSLQLYREFDLGTAKPTREEQTQVPHHLIDHCDPQQVFTAADYFRDATAVIEEIHGRGARALVVGGSGFYLRALIFGLWGLSPVTDKSPAESLPLQAGSELKDQFRNLSTPELFEKLKSQDPRSAFKIGPNDRYRLQRALEVMQLTTQKPSDLERAAQARLPDPRFSIGVIERPQEELEARIRVRAQKMVHDGLLEEVRALQAKHPNARALGSVGYAQAVQYLAGVIPSGRKLKWSEKTLIDEITLATRQLVKSQRTWNKSQFRNTPIQTFELKGQSPDFTEAFTWLDSVYDSPEAQTPS